MRKLEKRQIWQINGSQIPVKVVAESRRSYRIAFAKREVILRFPIQALQEEEKFVQWGKDWLSRTIKDKPSLAHKYNGENIEPEQMELSILNHTYQIHKKLAERPSGLIQLRGKDIHLSIPAHLSQLDQIEMRRKLISKFVAKAFKPYIIGLVNRINHEHFGFMINNVSLKYNRSNWGSCSVKRNINLSTRLLLAPEGAIRYVIIHELCHLIHMDHSAAFYAEIEKRMPEYRTWEVWLREHYLDF